MSNRVLRLSLSEIGGSGVSLTDGLVAQKTEVGPTALLLQNSIAIGGVCTDYSGNIYISDTENHLILKIQEGGEVVVFAGESGVSGDNGSLVNVPISEAKFRQPRGLACDRSGHIYVADTGNNQIRIIRDGFVSLLAGQGDGSSGFAGGFGGEASFDTPYDVAVGVDGVVYVADTGNNSIRRIIPGGATTIYAGSSSGDSENVDITTPDIFNSPRGLAVDQAGLVFVCDTGNYKIKTITKTGKVFLHSGSGVAGKDLGTTAFDCKYNDLSFCDIERSGLFYVVDTNTSLGTRVLLISQTGIPSLINDFTGTAINDNVVGVAVNESQDVFCISYGDPEIYGSSSSSSFDSSSSSSSFEPPVPIDKVFSGSGNPSMKVTMCWTDSDVTKTWLDNGSGDGIWTNGESKEIFANFYAKDTTATQYTEFWQAYNPGGSDQFLFFPTQYCCGGKFYFLFRMSSSNYRMRLSNVTATWTAPYVNLITTGMDTGASPPDFTPNAGEVQNHAFGQSVTTNGGITIKWEALDGSGSQAWGATTLSYGTRYDDNICP